MFLTCLKVNIKADSEPYIGWAVRWNSSAHLLTPAFLRYPWLMYSWINWGITLSRRVSNWRCVFRFRCKLLYSTRLSTSPTLGSSIYLKLYISMSLNAQTNKTKWLKAWYKDLTPQFEIFCIFKVEHCGGWSSKCGISVKIKQGR